MDYQLSYGLSSELVTRNGTSDEIKLSVGFLEGDTLAPYLFDIVIDIVLRNVTEIQTLGVTLREDSARYLTH
jgi:hypothetical protein